MTIGRIAVLMVLSTLLSACNDNKNSWHGTIEWDRAAVLTEVSEPLLTVAVSEGQPVNAGQLLLQLDPRRTDAELAAAQAETQRLGAQLLELTHGARTETIDAARAQLTRTQSDATNSQREFERARNLRKNNLIAQQDVDRARTAAKIAAANAAAAQAQLDELLHGTRPEQLAQADAALASAQAKLQHLQLTRARLDVQAPRAGRIDALPYRTGDQPPVGATLVSLLTGPQPYARIYVPEKYRADLKPGRKFRVYVDGIDNPYDAQLRNVRSEPTFTPYYALAGDDASRLMYRAELVLQGEAAQQLPPGIPCHAEPLAESRPNE
ncbi:MAG: HlyD family efflux transporter periplasmic adaptor subunit [Spongiibacteraceae bacterium]